MSFNAKNAWPNNKASLYRAKRNHKSIPKLCMNKEWIGAVCADLGPYPPGYGEIGDDDKLKEPGIVFSPKEGLYGDPNKMTLEDILTYEGNGYARTFYDADGVLKRQAHNFLAYSEDLSNAVWAGFYADDIATANYATAPDGTMTATRLSASGTGNAYRYQILGTDLIGEQLTSGFWYKSAGDADHTFVVRSGGHGGMPKYPFVAGSGWEFASIDFTDLDDEVDVGFDLRIAEGASADCDILIWGVHVYRSDLPMADNPETGDSYVPTAITPTGADLITNGTFDTDLSGWSGTRDAVLSLASGTIEVAASEIAYGGAGTTSFETVVGKTYAVTGSVVSATSNNSVKIAASTGADLGIAPIEQVFDIPPGDYSFSFVATTTTTYIHLAAQNPNSVVRYDNISVYKSAVDPSQARFLPRAPSYLYDADTAMWNAHNLLTYSEDFTNAAWLKLSGGTGSNPVVTANQATAPDGTLTADRVDFDCGAGGTSGDISRVFQDVPGSYTSDSGVWIRSVSGSDTVQVWNQVTSADVVVTETWQFVPITNAGTSPNMQIRTQGDVSTGGAFSVYLWGAHLYRTDLNGVVPNSGNPISGLYVPTTDTPVPATVNSESAYKNAGFYLESDAATNYLINSREFNGSPWFATNMTVGPDEWGTPLGSGGMSMEATSDAIVELRCATEVVPVESTVSISIFLQAKSSNFVYMQVNGSNGGALTASFVTIDLSSGTLGTVVALANGGLVDAKAYVEPCGAGCYRLTLSGGVGASNTQATCYVGPCNAQDDRAAVTGNSAYIDQADAIVSPIPQSPIPTNGAAETRPPETAQFDESLVPYPVATTDGNELVVNGDFATDDLTDWRTASGATISVAAKELVVENGTDSFGYTYYEFPTVIGDAYRLKIKIVRASISALVRVGDNAVGTTNPKVNETFGAEGGSIDETFIATATSTFIRLGLNNNTLGETATYDNVSVQEVLPLAMSFSFKGLVNYADENLSVQAMFLQLRQDGNNYIQQRFRSDTGTGGVHFASAKDVEWSVATGANYYSPGLNVPVSIASRHGATFINGAVDGVALTENTTPTEFPAIEGQPLQIGTVFNGHVQEIVVWGADQGDIGNAGIEEASGD